jgi:RNA polymerase sigma-70 factor (ECF subfamily)
MAPTGRTDEELLRASDAASFEEFYSRHVDALLGHLARRTGDAGMAADLTAETFATALTRRQRFKPRAGTPEDWLLAIAARHLADARRHGNVDRRISRRLGLEPLELTDGDVERIMSLAVRGEPAGMPSGADDVRIEIIDDRRR